MTWRTCFTPGPMSFLPGPRESVFLDKLDDMISRTVNKPDHTLELSTGEAVPISDACYKAVLQTLTR